ncbi:hypothetical protein ABZY16_27850 [Streptomyces sp. NPDC006553]|uniref:hypothetical protein n=1 Tax=unclassified Streptomyces TaxID=2593676 RepID=UPI0022506F4F|nr:MULTISPECIES: hypothetical protein [unclassified Streptomyces]MCX5228489.1 hypothetical protein [Streptomyces sp. NBC_00233]MDX2559526.1 hypothetical protein [Streptomyces sp. TX20-6-3]
MRGIDSVIRTVAHVLVGILVVWIALDLLDANRANTVVGWFHSAADWLAGWSIGLFDVSNHTVQVLLDYGIPAVVYVAIANLVASRTVART